MTGAPPLLMASRRACVKILKRIKDVGLARYDLLRPILQKIENPHHLRELELNSPHLTESDSELWLEFIKRDVPFWAEIELPENPDYEVYCSLRQQAASEVDEDAERMKRALAGLDKQKEKQSLKFVDPKKMGLPKEKISAKQKYAHYDQMMGGIAPKFVLNTEREGSKGITPYDDDRSRWKIENPKLPRKNPPARKSNLPKAMKIKRNDHLSVPTHRLNNGTAPRVVKAPRSFVEDYRIERACAKPPPPRNTTAASSSKAASGASQQKVTTTPSSQANTPRGVKDPIPPRKPQSTPTKHTTQLAQSSKSSKPAAANLGPKAPSASASASASPPGSSPNEPPRGRNASQPIGSKSPSSSPQRPVIAKRPVPPPRPKKRPADSAFIKPKKPRVT